MRGPCCVSRSPVARQAAPMLRSLQGAGDFRGAGSDPALAHTDRSPASAELQQVTTTQQLPPDLSESDTQRGHDILSYTNSCGN